jgi:hypothetical protein
MSFILEGADFTGKTTLARELESKGYHYHHEGPPPTGDLFTHYLQLMQHDHKMVYDRLYHGELVYGPILRGQSRISKEQFTLLERLRRARGIISILCTPPLRGVLDRFNKRIRAELIEDPETLSQIWSAYQGLHFDYGIATLKIPRYILETKIITLPLGYVGPPSARFLFVGETPNGPFNVPFFDTTNSSGFLNSAIIKAGYGEDEIAFTNAFDPDGRTQKILGFPVIIALGEKAAKECANQGKHGVMIPHPSYWKRFHAHEEQRYVMLLRRIRHENRSK